MCALSHTLHSHGSVDGLLVGHDGFRYNKGFFTFLFGKVNRHDCILLMRSEVGCRDLRLIVVLKERVLFAVLESGHRNGEDDLHGSRPHLGQDADLWRLVVHVGLHANIQTLVQLIHNAQLSNAVVANREGRVRDGVQIATFRVGTLAVTNEVFGYETS